MARSNYSGVEKALMDLMGCCELDRPGPDGGGTLADALFDVDVEGVRRRSIEGQHGPAGEGWPDNEPHYKRRKGGLPIGVLTGEMLSPEELAGTRLIGPDAAAMHYGRTGEGQQKARWFEEGTSRQPERPFYDSAPEDDPIKVRIVERQIERAIRRRGGE